MGDATDFIVAGAGISLEALLGSLPDGVMIVDPGGRIAFANARLGELSGYPSAELLGRAVEMLVPERLGADHERHRADFGAAPRLRPMGSGLDIRLRRRDGSEVPVEIQLSPIDIEGRVHTVAAVRDSAVRAAAEETVRESRQWFAVVSERERVARVLTDSVIGQIFGVGLALQAISSRIEDEATDRRIRELVSEIDQIIQDLRGHVFGLRS